MKNIFPKFSHLEKYMTPEQYDLIQDGTTIYNTLIKNGSNHISDYSFLVSTFAKSYEGFLKKFFYQINLIDQTTYLSSHFRVGKTLNPSLRYKRFSVFQKLADMDPRGEELAEVLWHAWKQSRNLIFHYFPRNLKKLSLPEAIDRIGLIKKSITQTGKFLDRHKNSLSKKLP